MSRRILVCATASNIAACIAHAHFHKGVYIKVAAGEKKHSLGRVDDGGLTMYRQ